MDDDKLIKHLKKYKKVELINAFYELIDSIVDVEYTDEFIIERIPKIIEMYRKQD